MIQVLLRWFHRYFSDPQAILLAVLLAVGLTVFMTFGKMLVPVFASVVIAYLLEGIISNLRFLRLPRAAAVTLVYSGFLALLLITLFILMPLLSRQISQLFQELPRMMTQGQELFMQLPQRYPNIISAEQVDALMNAIRTGVKDFGQELLSYSLSSIPALITLLVYLVLVPLLVFFFLKDKVLILNWFIGFLPPERPVAVQVWKEMDAQIGNYIRGKVYEIFVVSIATYIAFAIMNLNYSFLLAVLVGLSVIIPYIGAVVVTVPVIIVAYFQFGLGSEFIWLLSIYSIVQGIDGNILVPLLFSEAVNLHPVAIIVAVLIFGGLWGFWGIFFAIPLATLVKALLMAWPRATVPVNQSSFPFY